MLTRVTPNKDTFYAVCLATTISGVMSYIFFEKILLEVPVVHYQKTHLKKMAMILIIK